MNIEIDKEELTGNATTYMAQFTYNGVYYYMIGVMDKNNFDEVVKKIQF